LELFINYTAGNYVKNRGLAVILSTTIPNKRKTINNCIVKGVVPRFQPYGGQKGPEKF